MLKANLNRCTECQNGDISIKAIKKFARWRILCGLGPPTGGVELHYFCLG